MKNDFELGDICAHCGCEYQDHSQRGMHKCLSCDEGKCVVFMLRLSAIADRIDGNIVKIQKNSVYGKQLQGAGSTANAMLKKWPNYSKQPESGVFTVVPGTYDFRSKYPEKL